MADISAATWFELDASNTTAPPDGWPANMPSNQVEGGNRAIMGAVKRWYNHANATLTSGGAANVQTLTYGTAPAAYVTGDGYVFKAGFTNSGATTLNVNGLGAKAVQSLGAALVGNEIVSGRVAIVYYDGTQFQLVNSQIANVSGAAAGGDLSGTYPNPTVAKFNGSATVPIANGGSGATTALAAFAALVASSANLATPGHLTFVDGLILNWGITAYAGVTSVTANLDQALSVGALSAIGMTNDTTNRPNVQLSVLTTTQVGFSFDKSSSGSVYWFVLGR